MELITQSFVVAYNYQVYFTEYLFEPSNTCLISTIKSEKETNIKKILIFLDKGLLSGHPSLNIQIKAYFENYNSVSLVCPPIEIEGGERVKNDFQQVESILSWINIYGIDRHSYVMAIGGGAILDMVGFAAAIAHRGIRHLRVPTTALSQDDSGVGVKNSINYFGKKNFLGTFAPPFAVYNDYSLLSSLSDRDWRCGIAEAVKVALIKDADFFIFLESNFDALNIKEKSAIKYLIKRCAELHLNHIASGDPFEQGSSRPLDFGHWAAHKLEYLSNFSIKHGEAVAVGIALDVTYSYLKGFIDEASHTRIIQLLKKLNFTIYYPEIRFVDESNSKIKLLEGLTEFREHLGGKLTIMLLKNIGSGVEVNDMDENLIYEAITYLEKNV